MTTVSVWTGAAANQFFATLVFDGQYLYFGGYKAPAQVIRKIMRDIDETGT